MGKYTRKTERRSYTKERLISALDRIEQGHKIRAVAREFNIHEATLRRHQKIRKSIKESKSESLGRAPIFSRAQEREIAEHVKKMAKLFFGITATELRQVAYEYAEANNVKHNFNKDHGMAGPDWFRNFLKRNRDISLRKPESTSVNRISAFNKTEVSNFFSNLENVLTKYNFSPDRIYNVDETGCSTTPKEVGKRLAPTGVKQFGTVASWERGKNITVICAMSAAGCFVPPLFIFPRLRMSPQLEKNGPTGSIYTCSKNGRSNEQIFMMWLKHFQSKVCSTVENPVLLVLDNHSSHISLPIYEFCKNHGIVMVSIPPHTSHKLQPLDLTFFGPLKNAYSRQCNLFLKRKIIDTEKDNKLTPYDIAEIFKFAYEQVANVEKGVSGFLAAGICPINPEKFTDNDFAPAENLVNIVAPEISPPTTPPKIKSRTPGTAFPPSPQPSTSRQATLHEQNQKLYFTPNSQQQQVSEKSTPITKLLPIPNSKGILKRKNVREKQHSQILTSTPFKDELEEKHRKKNEKAISLIKRKVVEGQEKKPTKKVVQKKVFKRKATNIDSDTESNSSLDEKELCDDDELDDIISDVSEHDKCIVCGDMGKNRELWYRCTICGLWAHKECSGEESPKGFICDFCH